MVRNYFLLSLFFVITLLVSCTGSSSNELQNPANIEGSREIVEGDKIDPAIREADEKLYEKALMNDDMSACEQITESILRDDCVTIVQTALTTDEPLAVSRELSADEKLYSEAVEENNADKCSSIGDDALRIDCQQLTAQKVPEPVKTTELESDEEIYSEAIAKGNYAMCAQISDEVLRDDCYALLS